RRAPPSRDGGEQALQDDVGPVADGARTGGEPHREDLVERQQRQREQQTVAWGAARLPVRAWGRERREPGTGHRVKNLSLRGCVVRPILAHPVRKIADAGSPAARLSPLHPSRGRARSKKGTSP